MATARSLDDLTLDRIVTLLAAKSAADAASNPALAFIATRGKTSPWQELAAPLVNVHLSADNPDAKDYIASVALDYFVPILDAAGALDPDTVADQRAAYLKEQIRSALLAFRNYSLGAALGSVARKGPPKWSPIAFEDGELDRTIRAGSWSLDVVYAYDPDKLTGPALAELSITAGRWSALYTFPSS